MIVVLTEEFNVIVNSKELVGTTEYPSPQRRCHMNSYCYNPVWLCVCVCVFVCLYKVVKKSLCTWWLQYRKLQVMFEVSPASLQTFIDMPNCDLEDHDQCSTVIPIPNSNYVIMVSDRNCFKYLCLCFAL
jgi:hypothetical protein